MKPIEELRNDTNRHPSPPTATTRHEGTKSRAKRQERSERLQCRNKGVE